MPEASPTGVPRRLGLAAVVLLALAARLPTLGLRRVVEGDGVHYAALARDALAGDLSALGNPYWSNLWPAAIALTSAVSGLPVVEAGRLASLVSGSLLAAATALLGERLFGPLTGLAAGLAVAGHPWLIHFSSLVFSESFFALLLVLLVLAALAALRRPDGARALLLGLVGGMALVTRPEAFSTLLLALLLLALAAARGRGGPAAIRLVVTAGAVACAFLAVRAAICWHYYDVIDFGVGSKGTANLILGLAEDDAARERLSNEATEAGGNRLDEQVRGTSLVGFVLRHPALVARHAASNVPRIATALRNVLPPLPVALGRSGLPGEGPMAVALALLAWLAAALFALGAFSAFQHRGTRVGAALLAAIVALHLAGLALLNVHDRLVVVLAPLALVVFAHGLARTATLALASRAALGAMTAVLLAFGGLSALAVLRAPALAYGDDPPAAREAGLWLAARFGREIRLMTPSPAIAFYFYDSAHKENEVDLPWAPYDRLMAFARREGVAVVAAPAWYLEAAAFPSAPQLTRPGGDHPGLAHLATVGGPRPYCVHLFKVEPGPSS
jgi:4-amino-4-deoxy-L-arabinose transferase-like glycosyltransferase